MTYSKHPVALSILLVAMLTLSITASSETLAISDSIPFAEDADVPAAVRNECNLNTKLAKFIRTYAAKHFDKVVSISDADKNSKKLTISITDVHGQGGGAWSGSKSVKIEGTLTQNGKVLGTFRALRASGGGAFGGYKGTCSILGRCVKTLGKDVAAWAANPSMDSRLGDL